jgi:type IV secretory pathway protease TraF
VKYWGRTIGRKLLILVIAVVVFLALLHFFPINYTASMPFGLYMRLPAWNIQEGDLVELDNPMEDSSHLGVYVRHGLLKRVDHINEDGTYYVLGESELSYDSRYFGDVDKKYIKHRLIPLWTTYELPEWLQVQKTDKDSEI